MLSIDSFTKKIYLLSMMRLHCDPIFIRNHASCDEVEI